VLVRYFNKPGIDNYLRITIGTDKQMEQLVEKLSKIINSY
jgi:histidinol-phosphate aminotransferase